MELPPFYPPAANCRFFPKPEFYPSVSLPADCGWNIDFSGPYSAYLQFSHNGTPYLLGRSTAGNLVGFSMPTTADQRADICILRLPHIKRPATFHHSEYPEQRLSGYLSESERVTVARAANSISGAYFSFEG